MHIMDNVVCVNDFRQNIMYSWWVNGSYVPNLSTNYTIYMDFNIVHLAILHLAADKPVPINREMTDLTVVRR